MTPCTAKIVGISIAIIATLFLIQQFGTSFVGSMFSPVVVIWLLLNCGALCCSPFPRIARLELRHCYAKLLSCCTHVVPKKVNMFTFTELCFTPPTCVHQMPVQFIRMRRHRAVQHRALVPSHPEGVQPHVLVRIPAAQRQRGLGQAGRRGAVHHRCAQSTSVLPVYDPGSKATRTCYGLGNRALRKSVCRMRRVSALDSAVCRGMCA